MQGPDKTATTPSGRAVGCFMGLAIGDALGTTNEFKPRDSAPAVTDIVGGGPFDLDPGQWTDDTSMAVCLAEAIIAKSGFDATETMHLFRRWYREGHASVLGRCFDIGITTRAAIERFEKNEKSDPYQGCTDRNTAGNGSIMRLAPVAVFYCASEEAAATAARDQGRTTHGASECVECCDLLARILVRLIAGASWEVATAIDPSLYREPRVQGLARGDWRGKARDDIRSSGYVIDTLEAALWAVDGTASFREALVLAVNLGHDADTVGAVAGQLAGARHGQAGVPEPWLAKLAWKDRLGELCSGLLAGEGDDRPQVETASEVRLGTGEERTPTSYGIEIRSGLVIADIGGADFIIDTGSPVSFCRTGDVTFAGKSHAIPGNCWAGDADSLSTQAGFRIDGLLGCDILKGSSILIDRLAGMITVNPENGPKTTAASAVFDLDSGVPVIEAWVNGRRVRAVADTGAAHCYVMPELLAEAVACGLVQDFHPGVGGFEAPTFRMPIGLGEADEPTGENRTVARIPEGLKPVMLGFRLSAVIGLDVLLGQQLCFDIPRQRVVWR